jgi:hypothetical protein
MQVNELDRAIAIEARKDNVSSANVALSIAMEGLKFEEIRGRLGV